MILWPEALQPLRLSRWARGRVRPPTGSTCFQHQNPSNSVDFSSFSSYFGHQMALVPPAESSRSFHHVGEINTVVQTPLASKSVEIQKSLSLSDQSHLDVIQLSGERQKISRGWNGTEQLREICGIIENSPGGGTGQNNLEKLRLQVNQLNN